MFLPLLKRYWKEITLVVVSIGLALSAAWYVWSPAPPVQQVYHPEVKQADGSVIIETKPDAKANPPMVIPKGSTVERVVKVTVQAKTPIQTLSGTVEVKETIVQKAMAVMENKSAPDASDLSAPSGAIVSPCPPVTLDLALIRQEDGQRRVVASSQDGEILSAVDIPVENTATPPAPKLWAAGIVADPFKRTVGAFIDRDIGFIRAGVQINQREMGDIPNQAFIKLGIRF